MKKENSVEAETKIEEIIMMKEEIPPFDPYQASLNSEEKEVKLRTEKQDQETFATICKQLRVIMKDILRLKSEKPDNWTMEVEEKKVKGLMLMLSLRRLSRIQKVRVKDSREKSAEARGGVDGITLQLQNLLYEVSHLQKEVRKCLEFKSADDGIDLVTVTQFYQEAPANISRPEETVEDGHQQRLAQLHWELEQRRGQTQLSDLLTKEKEKVAEVISEQEEKLSSLLPRINAVLEATEPLQKALNLPLDAKRDQQQVSQLLPAPLYTLWVQTTAYGEAYGSSSSLETEIVGDAEAARKLIVPEEDAGAGTDDVSDSDGEIEAQEDNAQRSSRSEKKRRSPVQQEDAEDAGLKQLLALHPLRVSVTLRTSDKDAVTMTFHYARVLRIVTVKCSLDLAVKKEDQEEGSNPVLTDVLDDDSLLTLLFPGDCGAASPNPANEYQLQRVRRQRGLTPETLRVMGRPYQWAQTLAGLSFLGAELGPGAGATPAPAGLRKEEPPQEDHNREEDSCDGGEGVPGAHWGSGRLEEENRLGTETLSWKVSAEHMHRIVTAIRRRLRARLALHAQFRRLESASSTSCIPLPAEVLQALFPGKVCSELRSWVPLTWSDYEASNATKHLVDCGAVTPRDLVFKAVFMRQSVSLEAFAAVSLDYPNIAPIFGLKLTWGNREDTASTNPHIRQLEAEVNTYYSELASTRSERLNLLSLQLYRLATCLDILTEATCVQKESHPTPSAAEFPKEKIFFRPARGPDRSLPLKYLPKLGVFAQR